jgi:hypothetical protein
MKTKTPVFFCILLNAIAAYPQPLPLPSITPLVGEVAFRFRPTFSAMCTQKTEIKEKGNWFAKKSESSYQNSIVLDKGVAFVKSEIFGGKEYLRISQQLDDTGKAANVKPTIESNAQLNDEAKKIYESVATASFGGGAASNFGKNISQGEVFQMPICDVVGLLTRGELGGNNQSNGGYRLLGESVILNRKSLVMGGTIKETCYLPNGTAISFNMSGWTAYDLDSGLELQSSYKNESIGSDGQFLSDQVINTTCKLQGKLLQPIAENTLAQPNRQIRLTELRKLLDSGLIDKSQYDKKVEEILKSL